MWPSEKERGRQNPYALPGSGAPNWEFEQGQRDELKRQQDLRNGQGLPSAPAAPSPVCDSRPYVPPRKSLFWAVILCAVFGPLGLFYATKKGGFILIGLMLAIPMLTSTVDDAPMMYRMIALSMPVS